MSERVRNKLPGELCEYHRLRRHGTSNTESGFPENGLNYRAAHLGVKDGIAARQAELGELEPGLLEGRALGGRFRSIRQWCIFRRPVM